MSDEEKKSGSDLIHSSNLKEFLRNIGEEDEDTQVGSDASGYLEIQLENICREVWKQAKRNTVERNNKRVQEGDVRAAFDEVFYPYALLEDSIAKLGEYQLELERATDEYPILEFDEPETEEDGDEGSENE